MRRAELSTTMEAGNAINKKVLTSALILASEMWGNGELNVPKPSLDELQNCQDYLHSLESADMSDPDIQNVLSMLILNNIGRHFNIVANHRYWVRCSFELAKLSGILKCTEELEKRIDLHDLSKYGPDEALGYSIMFGFDGKFRKLEGEDKIQWEKALHHHYKMNKHHPQYYDGKKMPTVDLEESLIDMFGCRLERDLKPHYYSLTPGKILDLPRHYLLRYTVLYNKIEIEFYMAVWKRTLEKILSKNERKMWDKERELIKEWETKTGLKLSKDICVIKT